MFLIYLMSGSALLIAAFALSPRFSDHHDFGEVFFEQRIYPIFNRYHKHYIPDSSICSCV